jgi:hypothetical protein
MQYHSARPMDGVTTDVKAKRRWSLPLDHKCGSGRGNSHLSIDSYTKPRTASPTFEPRARIASSASAYEAIGGDQECTGVTHGGVAQDLVQGTSSHSPLRVLPRPWRVLQRLLLASLSSPSGKGATTRFYTYVTREISLAPNAKV